MYKFISMNIFVYFMYIDIQINLYIYIQTRMKRIPVRERKEKLVARLGFAVGRSYSYREVSDGETRQGSCMGIRHMHETFVAIRDEGRKKREGGARKDSRQKKNRRRRSLSCRGLYICQFSRVWGYALRRTFHRLGSIKKKNMYRKK